MGPAFARFKEEKLHHVDADALFTTFSRFMYHFACETCGMTRAFVNGNLTLALSLETYTAARA